MITLNALRSVIDIGNGSISRISKFHSRIKIMNGQNVFKNVFLELLVALQMPTEIIQDTRHALLRKSFCKFKECGNHTSQNHSRICHPYVP